jgi:cell wall-associated NlpC family hydrolase
MPAVTFGQFFQAIKSQESSGNYRAVNSRTGALGAYQVLPSNVPYWSQKYLGYKVSASQYLNSPSLQDKLASAVLHDYYRKWGPRGAASAWYSGSPSGANSYTRFRSNEPSIGEYVDGIMGKAVGNAGDLAQFAADQSQPRDILPSREQLTAGKTWEPKTPASSLDPTAEGTGMVQLDYSGAGLDTPTDGEGIASPSGTNGDGKDAPVGMSMSNPGTPLDVGGQSDAPPSAADPNNGLTTADVHGLRAQVLNEARKFLGKPYVWGAEGPTAFDCSGLIQYTLSQMGISIPRISYQQANSGKRTPLNQLKPGDLVAWDYSGRNAGADHIAFYAGNGKVLEAPAPGLKVRVHDLYDLGSAKPWGVSLDDLYGSY